MWHSTFLSTAIKTDDKHECMADGKMGLLLMQFISILDFWQKSDRKVLKSWTHYPQIHFYRLFSLTSLAQEAISKLINFYWAYLQKDIPCLATTLQHKCSQTSFTFGRVGSPSNPCTDNLSKACLIRLLMETIHCSKTFSFAFI